MANFTAQCYFIILKQCEFNLHFNLINFFKNLGIIFWQQWKRGKTISRKKNFVKN